MTLAFSYTSNSFYIAREIKNIDTDHVKHSRVEHIYLLVQTPERSFDVVSVPTYTASICMDGVRNEELYSNNVV